MSGIVTVNPKQASGALVNGSYQLAAAWEHFTDLCYRELGITALGVANSGTIVVHNEIDPLTNLRQWFVYNSDIGGDFVNPQAFGGGVPAPISLSAQGQNEAPHAAPVSTPPSRE